MYLLDTHTLIWWMDDTETLSREAHKTILNDRPIYVSAASIWEMSVKAKLGKLHFDQEDYKAILAQHFVLLPVTHEEGYLAGSLPLHHKDPFDRMLVAQATLHKLIIITRDPNIPRYGVAVLRA